MLDSVSSPITRRVYNMALNEFMAWYVQAPRPGFSKATVSAWRASLEARRLGSSSIIIRMSAIRKLAGEAAGSGGATMHQVASQAKTPALQQQWLFLISNQQQPIGTAQIQEALPVPILPYNPRGVQIPPLCRFL